MSEPIIPPIADDVIALKELLTWMRAQHWSIQGQIILGRIQLSGIVDENPRRLLAQQGGNDAPVLSDEEMSLFR